MHQVEDGDCPTEMLLLNRPVGVGPVGDKGLSLGGGKSKLPGPGLQLPAEGFGVWAAGENFP